MKAFSQNTILEVPFDSFKGKFDRTLHFKLRGANFMSKLVRADISQLSYNPNIILVKERKGLRWEYFPTQNGFTIAQCFIKYDAVSIILWIIMIVITLGIGIIFLLIKLIAESISTKNYIKRLNSKKAQVLSEEFGKHIQAQNINYTQRIIQQNPQTVVKSIPPPISNITEYFVAINGTQKGPYDLEKINLLIDIGQIQGNTLLWRQGMLQWAEAEQIEEINLLLK